MRLIHTADWQIGKVFRFVDDETMPLLQQARLDAIRSIGQLAQRESAACVLVAGDVYDKEGISDRTLLQPIEAMRAFPGINWHLIPGNHDPDRPNGLWQRAHALGLPDNLHVHLEPKPIALGEDVYLLPAALRHHQTTEDPTAWMNDANTPEGALRLGLAHGSITEFSANTPTPNLIDPDRAKQAGLAYLALGDWHGTKKINRQTWYAGTPEPDRFDRPEAGQALLVDLEGRKAPLVTAHRTGRFQWLSEQAILHDIEDIKSLSGRIREDDLDLSTVLLNLHLEGRLSLEGMAFFEQEIETSLSAALCYLRLSKDELAIKAAADDLDDLAHDPVIREAVDQLTSIAEAKDHPEREIAARALQHLYLACHKRHREAAA